MWPGVSSRHASGLQVLPPHVCLVPAPPTWLPTPPVSVGWVARMENHVPVGKMLAARTATTQPWEDAPTLSTAGVGGPGPAPVSSLGVPWSGKCGANSVSVSPVMKQSLTYTPVLWWHFSYHGSIAWRHQLSTSFFLKFWVWRELYSYLLMEQGESELKGSEETLDALQSKEKVGLAHFRGTDSSFWRLPQETNCWSTIPRSFNRLKYILLICSRVHWCT